MGVTSSSLFRAVTCSRRLPPPPAEPRSARSYASAEEEATSTIIAEYESTHPVPPRPDPRARFRRPGTDCTSRARMRRSASARRASRRSARGSGRGGTGCVLSYSAMMVLVASSSAEAYERALRGRSAGGGGRRLEHVTARKSELDVTPMAALLRGFVRDFVSRALSRSFPG